MYGIIGIIGLEDTDSLKRMCDVTTHHGLMISAHIDTSVCFFDI